MAVHRCLPRRRGWWRRRRSLLELVVDLLIWMVFNVDMRGAEKACLALSRCPLLSFFTRQTSRLWRSQSAHPVFLHTSISLTLSPTDTSDGSVAREGVVWHVKGRLPFRGTMAVQYGGPLVEASPAFHEAPTNAYPERFLSCTHLVPSKPHTHTPHSDLRAPTVLIIP